MLPLSGQTVVKHLWTNEEKRAVLDHLGRFISLGVVPGMHQKEPSDPEQLFMDCGKVFREERGAKTKTAGQKIISSLYRQINNRARISLF